MASAFSAWDEGDSAQARKRLLAAVETLQPEFGPDANDHVAECLVRCKLYLHLLEKAEGRVEAADKSLEEAKRLMANLPDDIKAVDRRAL